MAVSLWLTLSAGKLTSAAQPLMPALQELFCGELDLPGQGNSVIYRVATFPKPPDGDGLHVMLDFALLTALFKAKVVKLQAHPISRNGATISLTHLQSQNSASELIGRLSTALDPA